MSLSKFDRKRIERFAEFVDSTTGPRTHRRTSVDDELAPLTRLSRGLTAAPPDVAPEPEFAGSLRSFLVATAQRDGLGATAAPFVVDADPNAPNFAVPDIVPPAVLEAGRLEDSKRLLARVDRFEFGSC